MNTRERTLPDKQNIYGNMAEGIASRMLEVRKQHIKNSLGGFTNIAHRLEEVAVIRNVRFINDSKASNVNSAWYALESVHKPVIWLAGGLDNGNDYSPLIPLVSSKVRTLICLGTDNSRIIASFQPVLSEILEVNDMHTAVTIAHELAKPDSVVLLSPACPSFDRYENYAQRGDRFKQAVFQL